MVWHNDIFIDFNALELQFQFIYLAVDNFAVIRERARAELLPYTDFTKKMRTLK
jgi:hypothetical protein